MSSLFGGDSGPSAEELRAQRLAKEREKAARLDLAREQDLKERQRQAASRRGRGLLGQTTTGGAQGYTLFGEGDGKSATLGG